MLYLLPVFFKAAGRGEIARLMNQLQLPENSSTGQYIHGGNYHQSTLYNYTTLMVSSTFMVPNKCMETRKIISPQHFTLRFTRAERYDFAPPPSDTHLTYSHFGSPSVRLKRRSVALINQSEFRFNLLHCVNWNFDWLIQQLKLPYKESALIINFIMKF